MAFDSPKTAFEWIEMITNLEKRCAASKQNKQVDQLNLNDKDKKKQNDDQKNE